MTTYSKAPLPALFTSEFLSLRKFDKDLITALGALDSNLSLILNRGISFSDNVDCSIVSYTTNATANTEDAVAHGLGKVPAGYIAIKKDKAADIYDGTTANTKTNLYLKCTASSAFLTILVF